MSSNIQNSIWPNAGGTLGQNKVQIPTGTANDTIKWPTGDALVGNFVFNKGKLVGFVDTKALIANSSKTTTFPYDYVNISLPSIAEGEMTYNYDQCTYVILNGEVIKGDIPTNEELEIITKKYLGCKSVTDIKTVDPNYLTNDIVNGVWTEGLCDLVQGGNEQYYEGMFSNCDNLTTFTSDLSSLMNGNAMFYGCDNLTSFTSDLPSLSNGYEMFRDCDNLTSFTSDLPSLTNGYNMFSYCRQLTSFTADSSGSPVNLSTLMDGECMFQSCNNLTAFTSDLPSLTNGEGMFENCNNLTTFVSDFSGSPVNLSNLSHGYLMFSSCTKLKSFNSDLRSLTDGTSMFSYCRQLTSFNSDLRSLTHASGMFEDCKLDTASIKNIADTINTSPGYTINIGIGKDSLSAEDESYLQQIRNKGWNVYATCNGYSDVNDYYYTASESLSSSLTTLNETGESEMFAPKPYWAKPFNADEKRARYVDSEGNFYNILGGHYIYVDDPDTYGMFTSLEDAAANMRLTKIEK